MLAALKQAKTLREVLEAILPLLSESHVSSIKEGLKNGIKPAIATAAEIKFISQKFWEIFDGDVNAMIAMNDLRIAFSDFNINDDGSLFDKA